MEAKQFYTLLAIPSCADTKTLSALESLTIKYPWFSLAHQLLFESMIRNKDKDAVDYAMVIGAYSADRNHFYWRMQQPTNHNCKELKNTYSELTLAREQKTEQIILCQTELGEDIEIEEETEATGIVGNDNNTTKMAHKETIKQHKKLPAGNEYFNAEDTKSVILANDDPLSRFIAKQPKIKPCSPSTGNITILDTLEECFSLTDFVTETLALVYENQELYDLAIDTYKKLILQNPKKNTYFAAKIRKLKKIK